MAKSKTKPAKKGIKLWLMVKERKNLLDPAKVAQLQPSAKKWVGV